MVMGCMVCVGYLRELRVCLYFSVGRCPVIRSAIGDAAPMPTMG